MDSTCKNGGRNKIRFNHWLQKQTCNRWFSNYKNKLAIDDFPIPDPFKLPHGWMEEDEGMAFWPVLSYPDIFNFLMFYPSELGSKDLSDYKE